MKFYIRVIILSLLTSIFIQQGAFAQNKVVVVPLGGSDAPERGTEEGELIGYAVVRVLTDPQIQNGTMASGETPTVIRRPGNPTGQFIVQFPGEIFSINSQAAHATVYSGSPFFIAVDSVSGGVLVRTHNAAGTQADPFGFTVTLYKGPTGP